MWKKESSDNVANAEFSFGIEEHQDAQSGFVGEGFEELDMIFHRQNNIRLCGCCQIYYCRYKPLEITSMRLNFGKQCEEDLFSRMFGIGIAGMVRVNPVFSLAALP